MENFITPCPNCGSKAGMTYVGTKETGGASSTANPAVCSKCYYLATTEELIDADEQAEHENTWLETVREHIDKLAERIKALESQAADTERFTTKVQGHTAALAKLQDETAKLKGRAEEWKSALAGAILSAKKAPSPGPVLYKRELPGTGSIYLQDILFEAFRDWLLMYGTEEGAKLTEWSEPVLTRLVRGHNDGLNASGLFKCLTDTGHTISILIEQNRPSSSDQRS